MAEPRRYYFPPEDQEFTFPEDTTEPEINAFFYNRKPDYFKGADQEAIDNTLDQADQARFMREGFVFEKPGILQAGESALRQVSRGVVSLFPRVARHAVNIISAEEKERDIQAIKTESEKLQRPGMTSEESEFASIKSAELDNLIAQKRATPLKPTPALDATIDAIQTKLGAPPGQEVETPSDVFDLGKIAPAFGGVVGQVGAMIALSPLGIGVPALVMFGAEADGAYQQSKARGDTDEVAMLKGNSYGGAAATLEMLGLGRILKNAPGFVKRSITALVESGTEIGQEFAQDLIVEGKITKDTLDHAFVAGTLAFGGVGIIQVGSAGHTSLTQGEESTPTLNPYNTKEQNAALLKAAEDTGEVAAFQDMASYDHDTVIKHWQELGTASPHTMLDVDWTALEAPLPGGKTARKKTLVKRIKGRGKVAEADLPRLMELFQARGTVAGDVKKFSNETSFGLYLDDQGIVIDENRSLVFTEQQKDQLRVAFPDMRSDLSMAAFEGLIRKQALLNGEHPTDMLSRGYAGAVLGAEPLSGPLGPAATTPSTPATKRVSPKNVGTSWKTLETKGLSVEPVIPVRGDPSGKIGARVIRDGATFAFGKDTLTAKKIAITEWNKEVDEGMRQGELEVTDRKGMRPWEPNVRYMLRGYAASNMTTAFHELAHFTAVMSKGDLRSRIEAVMNKPLDQWNQDQHEGFADSFMNYLMGEDVPGTEAHRWMKASLAQAVKETDGVMKATASDDMKALFRSFITDETTLSEPYSSELPGVQVVDGEIYVAADGIKGLDALAQRKPKKKSLIEKERDVGIEGTIKEQLQSPTTIKASQLKADNIMLIPGWGQLIVKATSQRHGGVIYPGEQLAISRMLTAKRLESIEGDTYDATHAIARYDEYKKSGGTDDTLMGLLDNYASGLGRGLRIHREVTEQLKFNQEVKDSVDEATRFLQARGDIGELNQRDKNLIQQVKESDNPNKELLKIQDQLSWRSLIKGTFYQFIYNNMLSGIPTLVVNFAGNITLPLHLAGEQVYRGLVDKSYVAYRKARYGENIARSEYARESLMLLKALGRGFIGKDQKANKAGKDAFFGRSFAEMTKYEQDAMMRIDIHGNRIQPFDDVLDRLLRDGTTKTTTKKLLRVAGAGKASLYGMDAWFKTVAEHGRQDALDFRERQISADKLAEYQATFINNSLGGENVSIRLTSEQINTLLKDNPVKTAKGGRVTSSKQLSIEMKNPSFIQDNLHSLYQIARVNDVAVYKERVTFQGPIENIALRGGVEWINTKIPLGRATFPFMRIGSVTLSEGLAGLVPGLGLARPVWRQVARGGRLDPVPKPSRADWTRAAAQQIQSGVFSLFLYQLVNSGMITGGEEEDPAKRYSFKIGDTYVRYRYVEPFGTAIAIVVDLLKRSEKQQELGNDAAAEDSLYEALIQTSEHIIDNLYIQDVMKSLGGSKYERAQWLGWRASSMVPVGSFWRSMHRTAEGTREGKNIYRGFGAEDAIMSAFTDSLPPVDDLLNWVQDRPADKLSTAIPRPDPRLTPYGDLAGRQSGLIAGALPRSWLPVQYHVDEPDQFEDYLRSAGFQPSTPSRIVKVDKEDVELPYPLYVRYVQRTGMRGKEALGRLIGGAAWGTLTVERQFKKLDDTWNRIRKAERGRIVREYQQGL